MEKSTILTADILDIIFEGRNKDYGAYELRTTYRKRLALSVTVMLTAVLVFAALAFTSKGKDKRDDISIDDHHLVELPLPPEKKIELPPPPKQITPPPQPIEMKKFVTVRIVKDDEVKEDEKPPVNTDLDNVKIGNMNQEGVKGDDVVAPPNEGGPTGVIEAPKRDEDDDRPFMSVQIESDYPGGPAAWQRFLHKNLNYPQVAIDNGVQGTVTIQFIVDREGVVSDVQAISGPEELRAEAVRVIKKSGKWTPAIQNGKKVKSYKRQPFTFQLPAE